jgi:hypothetical protein
MITVAFRCTCTAAITMIVHDHVDEHEHAQWIEHALIRLYEAGALIETVNALNL